MATMTEGRGAHRIKAKLEKFKNDLNKVTRERDTEMKETDPEQSIIDEKNYEIKLLNLKINNAEIEIRLLDAGEAERKGLDEKLKEGQKELENMQKENPNGDEHPDEHTKK